MHPLAYRTVFYLAFLGCVLFTLLKSTTCVGQENVRRKLAAELRDLSKTDTNYINKLYKYGETYELDNNDSAFYWYERAKELSHKTNFINGQLRYFDYKAILLVYLGRYDEGIETIEEALKVSTRYNKRRFHAIELNEYGTIWQYKFEMNKAAEYYMKSYEIAEAIQDKALMNAVAGNLSGVFLEIKRYDKAREFSKINYSLGVETQDTLSMGYGLLNLTSCDLAEKRYSDARKPIDQILAIAKQYADESLELFALSNFGRTLQETGKADSAILVFTKMYNLAVKQDIDYHILFATEGLGDCYTMKRDFRKAIQFYEQSLHWADKTKNIRKQASLSRALASSYEELHDLGKAIRFRKAYDNLRDSIEVVEQSRNIIELEAQYQSEKQKRELIEKNLQIEQERNKANMRSFWAAGLALLLVGAVVVIVQRIKIARAREQSFRKELEVNVLKAGEDERSRIAKDLHDDVGATLSSIHVYSQAAQMHWENKRDEVPVLIQRISRNSENMMDRMSDIIWSMNINKDSGEKLVMRVKTFAQEVLGSKEMETGFDLDALEAIELTLEARKNLLLIFKESINNIAKYSEARMVSISAKSGDQLTIRIADNGLGFEGGARRNGNGLQNMGHRAALLGGALSINSAPGGGTEVILTVPLAKIRDAKSPKF